MRLPFAAIDKRIAKLEKRARLADVPPLRIVDTLTWDESDRLAYADATDEVGEALIERYKGPQPTYPAFLRVTTIVICAASAQSDDDLDDLDERPTDREVIAMAQASHAETLKQIELDSAASQAAEHAAEWRRLTRRD